MIDVVFVALILGGFAIAYAYGRAVARL